MSGCLEKFSGMHHLDSFIMSQGYPQYENSCIYLYQGLVIVVIISYLYT